MTEQHLYGGSVFVHRDSRHRYFVHFVDVESGALSPPINPPSVTGVSGIMDKSRFLVPWATRLMAEEIIERSQDLEDEGEFLDALTVKNLVERARGASDRDKSKAANLGTAVHDWIEKHILGVLDETGDPAMPRNKRVRHGVETFLRWEDSHDIEYLHTERYVYSVQHNYVGTLDIIARIDGVLSLADIKTSKAVYDEYWLQLGGYSNAFNEEFEEPLEQSLILHIPKETGLFSVHRRGSDFDEFEYQGVKYTTAQQWDEAGFLAARTLYRHQRGK
jgi:hypothetical protein